MSRQFQTIFHQTLRNKPILLTMLNLFELKFISFHSENRYYQLADPVELILWEKEESIWMNERRICVLFPVLASNNVHGALFLIGYQQTSERFLINIPFCCKWIAVLRVVCSILRCQAAYYIDKRPLIIFVGLSPVKGSRKQQSNKVVENICTLFPIFNLNLSCLKLNLYTMGGE